jgi:preprotein translocase SecE subunit
MDAVLNYFQEAVRELHQVRWPTRQQAVRLSVIVLIFTIISALFFGGVDFILQTLVGLVLSYTF